MAEAEKRLGEVLRLARTARGWTQEQLADRSALSLDMVGKLENARVSPTLGVLVKIAHGLGVDLSTLWEGMDALRGSELDGPWLGIDGLTQLERDFVTALARLIAAWRNRADLEGQTMAPGS